MDNKVEHVKNNISSKTINNAVWYPVPFLRQSFNWCERTCNRRIEECLEWILFQKGETIMLGTEPNQSSQRKGSKFIAYINEEGLKHIYRKERKKKHNLDGYLYAFKSVTGQSIKVGKAHNLHRRLSSYSGYNTIGKCLWVKHVPNRHTAELNLLRALQAAEHWHSRLDLGTEWFDCDFSDEYICSFLNLI